MSNSNQKPIALLTSGTRGDVQPFVALAQQLLQNGQQPLIITRGAFCEFVANYGIAHAELAGDPTQLLTTPEWQSALVYRGNPLQSIHSSLRYLQAARPLYARMLASAWQQTANAQAIIASLPTAAFAGQIAKARGIPYSLALLQPVGATRQFPSPMLPITYSLGPLNRLSHLAIELSLWLPWRAELNAWRKQTLGLPALPIAGPFAETEPHSTPRMYAFSPTVVPRPGDWPAAWQITGYWFVTQAHQELPAELQRFLERGPAPIAIGLGSMGLNRNPHFLQIVEAALAQSGQRAVLIGAEATDRQVSERVFMVPPLAHDLLFPHMALVVHHGGAGTTAAALHASIPSVVLPVGIDQFFWGQRIAALGCGPAPVGLHRVTATQLASMVEYASRQAVGEQARWVGERVNAETLKRTNVETLKR